MITKQTISTNYLKTKYPYFKDFLVWNRILALVFCLLTFPVVVFTFYKIQNGIWFDSLQYLTIQGNLIFWIFLLLYAFLHNRSIFNNNYFLICALAYITFVMVGFNTLLLPSYVKTAEFVSPYTWVSTVWFHMFSPICDITFGGIIFGKIKHGTPNFKIVGYGMIYIAYQFVYFCSLPFVSASIRYNNKLANYKYLGLTVSNHQVGGVGQFLTFNGKGNNLISISNQILNNFSGNNKTLLANAMVKNWFSVNNTAFVIYKNNELVFNKLPTTSQLAHIYNNLGISYSAIRTIDANNLVYFTRNVFSVYGTLTNLNKNVGLYDIVSINNKNKLQELFHALTNKFNPNSTSINLYMPTFGSYAIFGVIFGAMFAYFVLLCFWWAICVYSEKQKNKNLSNN